MSSQLYSKPTRSRTQKLVLTLFAVIVVLIAALVFVWLKPGSSTPPGAAAPATSAPAGMTSSPSTAPATSSSTGVPANGPTQWTIPVPGDGGPSTRSAAGVPRGYDASDSGATKAAVNAVVAGRWMKFRIEDPAEALGELAVADETTRPAVVKQLTPTENLNIDTGKKESEASPAGGKVLGAQLVQRDDQAAKVVVLWETFNSPVKGTVGVTIEGIGIELQRVDNDWLVKGWGTFGLNPGDPTKIIGQFGQLKDWVPVPAESWYW